MKKYKCIFCKSIHYISNTEYKRNIICSYCGESGTIRHIPVFTLKKITAILTLISFILPLTLYTLFSLERFIRFKPIPERDSFDEKLA